MDVTDGTGRAERFRHQVDLITEHRQVIIDGVITVDDACVTATEPAQAVAEGDVEVERKRRVWIGRRKPIAIGVDADGDLKWGAVG